MISPLVLLTLFHRLSSEISLKIQNKINFHKKLTLTFLRLSEASIKSFQFSCWPYEIFHGFSQVRPYLYFNHDGICHVQAKPRKDVNQKSIGFLNQKAEVELLLRSDCVLNIN